jgi:hypothetical protein
MRRVGERSYQNSDMKVGERKPIGNPCFIRRTGRLVPLGKEWWVSERERERTRCTVNRLESLTSTSISLDSTRKEELNS